MLCCWSDAVRSVPVIIWRGSMDDALALEVAIKHNCACQSGYCGAHQALLDQHWLDTILFLRFIRARLLEEEGQCEKRSSSSR